MYMWVCQPSTIKRLSSHTNMRPSNSNHCVTCHSEVYCWFLRYNCGILKITAMVSNSNAVSQKGNSVSLTTFNRWVKENIFGFKPTQNRTGKTMVNFMWCKLCAKYQKDDMQSVWGFAMTANPFWFHVRKCIKICKV